MCAPVMLRLFWMIWDATLRIIDIHPIRCWCDVHIRDMTTSLFNLVTKRHIVLVNGWYSG